MHAAEATVEVSVLFIYLSSIASNPYILRPYTARGGEQRAPDLAISAARGRAITSAIPQRVRWRTGRVGRDWRAPGGAWSQLSEEATDELTLAFIHVSGNQKQQSSSGNVRATYT